LLSFAAADGSKAEEGEVTFSPSFFAVLVEATLVPAGADALVLLECAGAEADKPASVRAALPSSAFLSFFAEDFVETPSITLPVMSSLPMQSVLTPFFTVT
jgi:hypothetical protein